MNSAIVAALTFGFANLSDEQAKALDRQTRPEIQKIFDDSNLNLRCGCLMFGNLGLVGKGGESDLISYVINIKSYKNREATVLLLGSFALKCSSVPVYIL